MSDVCGAKMDKTHVHTHTMLSCGRSVHVCDVKECILTMLFAAVPFTKSSWCVLLVLFPCDVMSQLSHEILSKLSVKATLNSFFRRY